MEFRIPSEASFTWQKPVIRSDLTTSVGLTPSKGHRYVIAGTGGAWAGQLIGSIAWYDGAAWRFDPPAAGWVVYDLQKKQFFYFETTSWEPYVKAVGPQYAVIRDQKPAGTQGGSTASAAGWITRDLNTLVQTGSFVTNLASNVFTLEAGTYSIHASAPGYDSGIIKSRLYRVSETAGVVLPGTAEDTLGSNKSGVSSRTVVAGLFTTTGGDHRLEFRASSGQSNDGLGKAANWGDDEVYSIVELWKLA